MSLELCIYVLLFRVLYKETKNNSAITKEMFRVKQKRNQITLVGQAMTFLIEIAASFFIQILLIFITDAMTIYSIFQVIFTAAVTATQLISSPEIRRQLKLTFKAIYVFLGLPNSIE